MKWNSSEILLENARVVDPLNGMDETRPVAVKNGRFASPEELRNPMRLDCSGKVLCPGFIDLHIHLRDPGQTHKEDMASGTAAAAAGGFTTILAMPNTLPAADSAETIRMILEKARGNPVQVLQSGAITNGREGLELTDFQALKDAGCPALTDDGSTTQSAGLMRRAMQWAASLHLPVIDHCEDTSLSKPGVMHLGEVSRRLGLPGQPRSAEETIVARDILLAEETGCRLHLQHLSSAGSIRMLAEARKRGLPVTGEATPHHLFLTDKACETFGANAKMAPPLREESDRLALIQALVDGVVTCIATDHAPHTAEEKSRGWQKAPFGIVGIEAVVPICLTELYHKGILSLPQLVSLFTKGPREVLGLPVGAILPGEPAALTVLELEHQFTLHVEDFLSHGRNCPYDGWKCRGRASQLTFQN